MLATETPCLQRKIRGRNMIDLVNKYHIQDALDELEERYPEAFVNPNDKLEDYIPASDRSMILIRKFLDEIDLNDRLVVEQQMREKKIKSGVDHYQTVSEMARRLHYSVHMVNEIIDSVPSLRAKYIKNQRRRDAVTLVNVETGEEKEMENVSVAAHFMHVPVAFLKKKLRSNWQMEPVNGWRAERTIKRKDRNWQITTQNY